MRAIDGDALKREFRQTFVDGEQIDVREVIERIELLAPTIGPVIVWTPVEKGIPDKPATWYLVSFSWGTTGFLMHGDIRRGAQDGTVTAWAEKPAPYKAVTP
jgi:hypothetical protein